MHIISKKTIVEYYTKHAAVKSDLEAWFDEVKQAQWDNSADIKSQYVTASFLPDNRVVFKIHGNSYRLLVRVNYNSKTVFVKFIGTHAEYDKYNMETI